MRYDVVDRVGTQVSIAAKLPKDGAGEAAEDVLTLGESQIKEVAGKR